MESTDLPTVDATGEAPEELFVKTSGKGVPGDWPDVPQVLRITIMSKQIVQKVDSLQRVVMD